MTAWDGDVRSSQYCCTGAQCPGHSPASGGSLAVEWLAVTGFGANTCSMHLASYTARFYFEMLGNKFFSVKKNHCFPKRLPILRRFCSGAGLLEYFISFLCLYGS